MVARINQAQTMIFVKVQNRGEVFLLQSCVFNASALPVRAFNSGQTVGNWGFFELVDFGRAITEIVCGSGDVR